MKTQKSFTVLFFLFSFSITVLAENPIATLQHKGQTKVFYGQNSFVEAYNAALNGDTLNLSVGGFTPPPSISKGITVVGAGYYPDSASEKIRTTITGTININAGSDSLHLEGIYVNGHLYFASESTINKVKILRCRFESAQPVNNHTSLNKWSFDECIVEGFISSSNMVSNDNLSVKHCIINNVIEISTGINAVIEGNIFLYTPSDVNNPGSPIYRISGALIQNNIFLTSKWDGYAQTNTVFYNNVFATSPENWGNNGYSSNNYSGVSIADIFVNQTGNTFNYTHDYHLKNPEKYIGTDGTQVGLYGGLTPFKEKGLPFNPQITSKTIAHETDNDGNLNISVTVAAQER